MPPEKEVFRLTPVVGRAYKVVVATRKEWSDVSRCWRYYATTPMRYMGPFIRSERCGYGDGGSYAEIYEHGRVDYDYEGMTCLEEVTPQPGNTLKLATET